MLLDYSAHTSPLQEHHQRSTGDPSSHRVDFRAISRQPSNTSSFSSTRGGAVYTPSPSKRVGDLYQNLVSPTSSNQSATSFHWRAGRPLAGMLDTERSRTRRERTFIGSECAVCEEPLEHTLRGEKVLQFSCGHVCHEACFYEYIREFEASSCPTCNAPLGLDTSRGGNVLDLGTPPLAMFSEMETHRSTEKLGNIVRSATNNDSSSQRSPRSLQNTPTPWDHQATRDQPLPRPVHNRNSHDTSNRDSRERGEHHGLGPRQHLRNESNATGNASSTDYDGQHRGPGRRYDYESGSIETDLSSARGSVTKNPIPPPHVTVRSEFPTLNRSRQQQSLTCLVTIEVPEGKWYPEPDDLRYAPPVPSLPQDDVYSPVRSPLLSGQARETSQEAAEVLDRITEDLRSRVDNWHGLDFARVGKLRHYSTMRVGKDRISWQELECYLFSEMLICVKEKKGAQTQPADGDIKRNTTRCTLKGAILIKKHLRGVDSSPGKLALRFPLPARRLIL